MPERTHPPHAARATTAVGYLRRSTDRQEQSIPDQRRAVEAYAATHGIRIRDWYVDDAISGTSALKRKAFQQMVADAQQPRCPFRLVVVYDVKRFGRLDNDEAGYYRHVLRTHGVEICYVTENFNGDATDDLLRPVKQWQARQESKDLSKVTIRGQLTRAGGGWWMGGAPPYGYDLEYLDSKGEFMLAVRYLPNGSKEVLDAKRQASRVLEKGESVAVSKRDRARLVPSTPERVQVVRRIFRASAEENRGLRAIADLLNREGIPSPRAAGWARIYEGLWSLSTIRSILLNPHYVGDLVWNRRTDARFHRIQNERAVERKEAYGARLEPNPQEDWLVIRDAHEALISRALWEKAKTVREGRQTSRTQAGGNRRVVGGWKGQRARFLLSGLVFCGRCGGRYEGCHRLKGKRRTDGSTVKTFYYGCSNYIRKGASACSFGAVRQDLLEERVIEEVLKAYAPYRGPEGKKRLAKEVRDALGSAWEDGDAARQKAQETVQRVKAAIANLLDNLTATNRDHVDRRIQELEQEKTAAERRLEELDLLAGSRKEIAEVIAERATYIEGLESMLRHAAPEQRVASARTCVREVHLDAVSPHNVHVSVAPIVERN